MTITNKGTTPDRVSCVSDDASEQCQIHSMTMEGGVMKMRPVEGGLEIKPGETVTLKPGGYHMMFVGLNHPLEQGKTVKADAEIRSRRHGQGGLSDRGDRRAGARRRRGRRHLMMQGGAHERAERWSHERAKRRHANGQVGRSLFDRRSEDRCAGRRRVNNSFTLRLVKAAGPIG